MWRTGLGILLTVFVISSCKYNEEFKTHETKLYTVTAPDYFYKTQKLSETADLQLENKFRSMYMVVLQEYKEKNEDLESYSYKSIKKLTSQLENSVVARQKNERINGMLSKRTEITGTINDIDFQYNIAYINGQHYFYEIAIWTPINKMEKVGTDIEKIIASFNEL